MELSVVARYSASVNPIYEKSKSFGSFFGKVNNSIAFDECASKCFREVVRCFANELLVYNKLSTFVPDADRDNFRA